MPIITQLNNANTFQQWLQATNGTIDSINKLSEGPSFPGNTLLILTRSGTTLNVLNNAIINTQTSNTITTGNLLVSQISTGNTLKVEASANIAGNLYCNNLFVTSRVQIPDGAITFTNVTYNDLFIETLSNTSTLTVRNWMHQQGANSRFDGTILFTNTTTFSINTLGSIWVANSIFASRNVMSGNLTVNTSATILSLNVSSIDGRNLSINSNLTVGADKTANFFGNVVITGNTSLGPYTETVNNLGDSSSGSVILNLRTASVFRVNVSGGITLTVTNPPPPNKMGSATIIIKSIVADASEPSVTIRGARHDSPTTYGTNIYSYKVAPVLDMKSGNTNIVNMFTVDGGFTWNIIAPIIGG